MRLYLFQYGTDEPPAFLFFKNGVMVDLVKVANASLISAVINKHTFPVLEGDLPVVQPAPDPGHCEESKLTPKAAEAMWSFETSDIPDLRCLPSARQLNHALAQLLVTFHHQTQQKATYAADGTPPKFEPTLALYCPLEGGEVWIHYII
jgi:hypothetical protein